MSKSNAGRPVLSDPMDTLVRVRCRETEKGKWIIAALRRGQTLSEWLRELAANAVDRP